MARKREASPLHELVEVSRRYQRSIHLERDEVVPEALEGYQPTPVALKSLDRILAGIEPESGARAWSLTGPYGSGKSSFAVFLAALVSGEKGRSTAGGVARRLLRAVSDERYTALFGKSGRRSPPKLVAVLSTAERQPLSLIVLRALATTIDRLWAGRRRPKLFATVNKRVASLEAGRTLATSTVVRLFEKTTAAVTDAGLSDGLVLIVDEAGKALEYAAQHPRQSDVLLLQELAEFAARSGDNPFVFITVFHQAFKGYAARLSPAQRNEWEKVQGRFEDVAFVDGWDQTVRFVADALVVDHRPQGAWKKASGQAKNALDYVQLPTVLAGESTRQDLLSSVPLHPYVVLLLGPLFRSGLFQNERSLFAFLSSGEPAAFQEFLAAHSVSRVVPLYTVDRLFDYVVSVLDSRGTFARGQALQVAEISLRRVPDEAGNLGAALVKAIALISWLGEKVGLKATPETLRAALQLDPDDEEFEQVLAVLKRASIITYRRFRSSYVLWEGSDIRIDELLERSPARELASATASKLLDEVAPQKPLVARRHLFETGTLRFYPVRFVAEPALRDALLDESGNGDGDVLVVISGDEGERDAARKQLTEQYAVLRRDKSQRPVVTVIPANSERILDLLRELAALRHLPEVEPKLHEDPVAKREVVARVEDVRSFLRSEVSAIFGQREDGTSAAWFFDGGTRRISRPREVSALISDVSDQVYDRAPHLHNELLNRNELSSAATKARRNLVVAMLSHADEDALGIDGFPPEMSMYLSLVREHRLHGRVHGVWRLTPPPKSSKKPLIHQAWHAMTTYFNESEGRRVCLDGLYEYLQRPPFGLKLGVIPVLFVHYYALNAASLALYEGESFVPKLDLATVERLLRRPTSFEIQWYRITEERTDVLRRLGEELGIKPALGREAPSVLQVVKRLTRIYNDLPHYSQLTKRLSPETVEMRHALTLAKEPAPLVFREFPAAFGIEPFGSRKRARERDAETFARALAAATNELSSAYDALLDTVEGRVANAFGMTAGKRLRHRLARRASRVLPHAVASKLRSFLVRVIDDDMPRADWLVSVATLLGKKPPEHWVDTDLLVFESELRVVQQQFAEVEGLALRAAQFDGPENGAADAVDSRLIRVSVSELGHPTMERVVMLGDESKASASLQQELESLLRSYSGELSMENCLAIVGSVAASLIAKADERAVGGPKPGVAKRGVK